MSEQPSVVRMANDIARNLSYLPPDELRDAIAGHIRSFWDPRMRRQLREIVERDPSVVEPAVAQAIVALDVQSA